MQVPALSDDCHWNLNENPNERSCEEVQVPTWINSSVQWSLEELEENSE